MTSVHLLAITSFNTLGDGLPRSHKLLERRGGKQELADSTEHIHRRAAPRSLGTEFADVWTQNGLPQKLRLGTNQIRNTAGSSWQVRGSGLYKKAAGRVTQHQRDLGVNLSSASSLVVSSKSQHLSQAPFPPL